MKKIIKKVKKEFKNEIKYAKKIGYDGIIIRLSDDSGCIYIDDIYSMYTIEDIVIENGWSDDCLMIDFCQKNERVIRISELLVETAPSMPLS